MVLSTLKELISYLRHPWLSPKHIPPNIWSKLSFLWLVSLSLSFFLSWATDEFIFFGWLSNPGHSVFDDTDIPLIIGSVLLAPALEEVLFRMQLKSFESGYFFVCCFLAIIIINLTNAATGLITATGFYILIYAYHKLNLRKSLSRKQQFWKKWFPFQFYITAFTFAVIHIFNYDAGADFFKVAILYTLPQLVGGLTLGYTRMRYGMRYAIILHTAHNLVPCIIMLASLN